MKLHEVLLCSSLCLIGCKTPSQSPNNAPNISPIPPNASLTFGRYTGECPESPCIAIFRLESDRLLEDTARTYPKKNQFYVGRYKPLSETQWRFCQDLWQQFPTALLSETQNVLGNPDEIDQGGLYVEYHWGSIHQSWLIDPMKTNVPIAYHPFIDQLSAKMKIMKAMQ